MGGRERHARSLLQKQLMHRREMRIERQNGPAHRPGVGTDRPFDQLRPDHPFPFDAIERALSASNDFPHELPVDFAVDDDRFQIEQGGRPGDGHRDGGAGFVEPPFGHGPELGAKRAMIVRGRGRRARRNEALFEDEARGGMQQLSWRQPVAQRERHRADRARVAVGPAVQAPVDDEAPPDERPDEQVKKRTNATPLAHDEFRRARGGRVFGELDGQSRHRSNARSNIDRIPSLERGGRCAQEVAPSAEP